LELANAADADKNVRAPLAERVDRKSQIECLLALDASQGLDETARATLNSLLTPEQARALADALQDLRACDLAVGSGAFPVALLHELVNVARLAETRARGKDPATSDPRWLFDTKTRFIERVLYGVDIQARAIEICELRLWLSLVVDYPLDVDVDTCEKQSFRDNLKRLPALPNLDFKIRRANSLIDTIHGEPVPLGKLHASDQARVVLNKLTTAKREFYRADSVPDKRKLRFAIYAAMAELAQIELTVARNELGLLPDPENAGKVAELDQGQKAMAKVLAQIRDARKMKAADQDDALERIREFFDDETKPTFVWQLDFAEVFHREKNPGFDIMVANPPYVLFQEGVRDRMTYEFFKKHYVVAAYKIDLYHLFIERGVNLLNERGALAYITPSNFVSNNYAVSLRRFLLTQTHLAKLVFFDERVFEASVHSLVFCAQRCRTSDEETAFLKAEIEGVGLVLHEKQRTRQQDLLTDKCLLVFQEHSGAQPVLKRLSANGQPLGEIASVNFGMQLRDRTEHLEDVIESPAKADLTPFHRPCLTGKDIARYNVTYPKRYCYFNRVAKRGGCWDEATHNARNKILVRQIGLHPNAAMDTRGWAVLNTAFMIIPRCANYDARFLLGVINSIVMRFYWLNTFKDDRKTFPKIKGEYLKLLPICSPTADEHDALVALVDRILKAKRADEAANTAALEREIDERVYRLYGLTAEEIKVVEEAGK
jgi:methylase of polypeptide subunit release factors